MVILHITSLNFKGKSQECCLGVPTIEIAFDILTDLTESQCHLVSVYLKEGLSRPTMLPIEAFDGEPMSKSLRELQQEWEEVLSHE